MNLLEKIFDQAKNNVKCIVLPESTEPRTLQAADVALKEGLASIQLIGNKQHILSVAADLGLKNIEKARFFDPETDQKMSIYTDLLFELRKSKGMTKEEAQKLSKNPLYLATLMIKNGDADGEVAGAQNSTGNVLRPALQIVKTKPGVTVVSGAFLILLQDETFGEKGVFVFADCAVTPDPTAKQLAEIAIQSADSAKAFGIDPRIAMISYSTGTSGAGADVEKVAKATEIAKQRRPDLLIDGPLQYDAASVESVGRSKAPNSQVAGRANVFIFPDLNTGNTTYKAVQRSANVVSVGPMLQGLNKPVNDLSRGCSSEDVYKLGIITAAQAVDAL